MFVGHKLFLLGHFIHLIYFKISLLLYLFQIGQKPQGKIQVNPQGQIQVNPQEQIQVQTPKLVNLSEVANIPNALRCSHCSGIYNDLTKLKIHMGSVHGINIIQLKQQSSTSAQACQNKQKNVIQKPLKKLYCDHCTDIYVDQKSLDNHMKNVHGNVDLKETIESRDELAYHACTGSVSS